jgi:hypothetical protein
MSIPLQGCILIKHSVNGVTAAPEGDNFLFHAWFKSNWLAIERFMEVRIAVLLFIKRIYNWCHMVLGIYFSQTEYEPSLQLRVNIFCLVGPWLPRGFPHYFCAIISFFSLQNIVGRTNCARNCWVVSWVVHSFYCHLVNQIYSDLQELMFSVLVN